MKKRDVVALKIFLLKKGLTQTGIANELGEKIAYVNKTILGERHNRKVLSYLLEKGCPKKYLALPKDMEKTT